MKSKLTPIRSTLIVVVVLASLVLAACQPAATPTPAATQPPAATEALVNTVAPTAVPPTAAPTKAPIKLVLARVGGDPFYKTVECGAIAEAKQLGVDLQVQSMANFEIAEQTRVLDAIIQTKPTVLISAPVDPNGVLPVFKRVREAGIKIVTYDTRLSDTSMTDTEVITDNYEQGKMAADALVKAIGDKGGKVFVLSDMPGIYTTGEEQRGFEDQIKTYSNINYLGTQYHNNDQNNAVQIVNSVLVANPDLAGIFATNTFGSQAVATALTESKKVGVVKVVAYDTTDEIIQGLKDGVFSAVLAYEAEKEGVLAVQAAVKLANGESVEKLYNVGNVVLTKENVDNPDLLYLRYTNECK